MSHFEEVLNVPAANHLLSREMVHGGRVDERNRVAERLGNIQFVGGEDDALVVQMRQISEQMAEFVSVGHIQKRCRFVE